MLSRLKLATVSVEISRRVITAFKIQAKLAFPRETIAYMIGEDAGTAVSIENLWFPEDAVGTRNSIMLHDAWRTIAQDAAKDLDMTVLGTIHSHPYPADCVANPAPSVEDLVHGDLGPLMGICTVLRMRNGGLRSAIRIWGPMVPVSVKIVDASEINM